jgi:hypothetical protein
METIIREGDNLVSTLVSNEGKDKVISKGQCPVCAKDIVFDLDIVNRDKTEALVGSLYELFLLNHELCFSCRSLFERWCREHKEFCEKHHIGFREVGNKFLEKAGKKPVIGLNTQEQEEEATEEVATPSQTIGDNTGIIERRSKVK